MGWLFIGAVFAAASRSWLLLIAGAVCFLPLLALNPFLTVLVVVTGMILPLLAVYHWGDDFVGFYVVPALVFNYWIAGKFEPLPVFNAETWSDGGESLMFLVQLIWPTAVALLAMAAHEDVAREGKDARERQ